MPVVQQLRRVVSIEFNRCFSNAKDDTLGYGFPCDADGNIWPLVVEGAIANLEGCLSGKFDVIDKGVVQSDFPCVYHEPTILKCDCGTQIDCYFDLTMCKCGAQYDLDGVLIEDPIAWMVERPYAVSECFQEEN